MAIVYRYRDLADGCIKYVGIVWSNNRTLKQRVKEHAQLDKWAQTSVWQIEYLNTEVKNRTDAEMLEAHFIAKFGTGQYFNQSKVGWGECSMIKVEAEDWKIFSKEEERESDFFIQSELVALVNERVTNGAVPEWLISSMIRNTNIKVLFPPLIRIDAGTNEPEYVLTADYLRLMAEKRKIYDVDEWKFWPVCLKRSEVDGDIKIFYLRGYRSDSPSDKFTVGGSRFIDGNEGVEIAAANISEAQRNSLKARGLLLKPETEV